MFTRVSETQNQALSGVLFLYKEVLCINIGTVAVPPRARMPVRVPVVLTPSEVRAVIGALDGVPRLVVMLFYGAGLRLQECLELRVKGLDIERREITIRRGKGQKDRRVMLPEAVCEPLLRHLAEVRQRHLDDRAAGCGRVVLPDALERKCPNAPTEWAWQFVFPAGRICRDERYGPPSRFHLHETVIQRAVTFAARSTGIPKRIGCHTFRHSFANSFARDWFGHSYGAGAAGSCRRPHDDGVHACVEPRRTRRQESARPVVGVCGCERFAAILEGFRCFPLS